VFTEFVAVRGEREFSGRLLARPLQAGSLAAVGLSPVQLGNHQAEARGAIAQYRVTAYVRQIDQHIFEVPAHTTENEIARKLMATGHFEYVEPDWIVYPLGNPDDTQFSFQWHHNPDRMQSSGAWGHHTGNPSVSVGICDTGILTTHEDLLVHRLPGYNAVDQKWEGQEGGQIGPVHPHGTQTTGCAAANGNNTKGVAGVGWNLSHRMLRVSNVSSGSAALSVLQHAAMTAVEKGDKVASVSYSGVTSRSNLATATYIKSQGGLLVWAAGNNNRNLNKNRDNDDLIVAGATDSNDAKASFSAYGRFVDVVGPGVGVLSTDASSDSSYRAVSGTSFACPLTAGVCAMIWSANPSLTPNQVESILKQSCDDLGAAGVDNTFGYGRINTYNAVVLALAGGPVPVAEFTGSPTSGTADLLVSFTDQSTESPTSWSWNFGDGGSSTVQNPNHTYTTAGTYTVILTATNANGFDGETKVDYITVNSPGGNPTSVQVSVTASTQGKKFQRGKAVVVVTDDLGVPVSGATVTGNFSGTLSQNGVQGTTDTNGSVTLLTSQRLKQELLVTFCVIAVNAPAPWDTLPFDPSLPVCDSNH